MKADKGQILSLQELDKVPGGTWQETEKMLFFLRDEIGLKLNLKDNASTLRDIELLKNELGKVGLGISRLSIKGENIYMNQKGKRLTVDDVKELFRYNYGKQ